MVIMIRKTKYLSAMTVILLILAAAPLCIAGEVITDTARQWAKEAVKQEKSLSSAPQGNTVAVLNFKNASSDVTLNPLQKGFAFMLMTDLASVPGIQLVERVKLQALVQELNMGASGIVENTSAPRMGMLLRANYLIGGELTLPKTNSINVGSYLWGVSGNAILGQPSASGSLNEIFDLEKKILFAIIDQLKITLSEEQRSKLRKPITTNFKAFYYFSKGLESSDRGNYQQAQTYYNKAVAADPQLGAASSASRELIKMRLTPAKPKEAAVVGQMEAQNSNTASLKQNNSTFMALNPYQIEKGHGSGQVKVSW
jgi:TolB-like protein